MKKFLVIVAMAAVAVLADSQLVSARRGGCGGGGGGCGGCGGGMMMGGCGGGMMMGGCGMGGCGMGGGCGMMMGGCGMGGCGMGGGYVMGGGSCPGGVCALNSLSGGISLVEAGSTEATLIVTLPEDATLTIGDEETTSTSAQRVFVSPALEQGKEYEYTLKAKVVRAGETKVTTAKVTVRAGATSQVELKLPAAGVAAQ